MVTKSQIRSANKIKRRSMSKDQAIKAGIKAGKRIMQLLVYETADYLLAYSSIQNEVDLREVIDHAINAGKKVFLPRVKGDEMTFYLVNDMEHLVKGSFDISEPIENYEYSLDKQLLNDDNKNINIVAIIPGLAFSKEGQRIGFGKGFYDRFLSKYKDIYKIGLCYDWQITDSLQEDETDIRMDMIITDEREVLANE